MHASTLMQLVLGTLPFLPRGRGALILILGGMLVLGFSLLWSLTVPRRNVASPGPRRARGENQRMSRRLTRAVRVAPHASPRAESMADPPWIRATLSTVARAGLGRAELVRSEPTRHTIRLENCKSCRERRRGSGCEHERATLEKVLQVFAPRGRVVEVACNSGRLGACTFELRPGVAGP